MIYFAQPVDGGPIKIGSSENVPRRIKALQCQLGVRLAVLATMSGGEKEEEEIHERFAHLRIGRKEQFRPARELMEFIGKPLFAVANHDLVGTIEPSPSWTVGWKGKRGPKPKEFYSRFLLSMSESLYNRLFAYAAREGITASEAVRRLADEYLR